LAAMSLEGVTPNHILKPLKSRYVTRGIRLTYPSKILVLIQ
jgi:hypothetical protein